MHYSALVSAKSSGTAADELSRLIGSRVREHRARRGWTLEDLAGRSGVSRRMLINIEQGSANPSIATLLRVSDALGIGLPGLVDAGQTADLRVTRSGQAPVLWQGPCGGSAVLVAGTEPPDVVELWDWSLAPGESHHSEPHATGTRELLLVLEGQVQVQAGPACHVLGTGDSAAFRSDIRHSYANPASGPGAMHARFALTVYEPHVGTEVTDA
jgi:transcriptional regulator with XRE-family HTH domain